MDNKNEYNREGASLCNPETRFQDQRKDKDQNGDELRQKLIPKGKECSSQQTSKDKQIQGWLSGSSRPPRPSEAATEILHPDEYSSNGDNYSIGAPSASTRSSAIVAVDVNDSDYRESLSNYNIYIECEEPPIKLMQRATEVIGRPRESAKMEDRVAQEVIWRIKMLQTADEDAFNKELAPDIVPTIIQVPQQRLARLSSQLWFRAVAIPLLPDLLNAPSLLLLPRPKPDYVFGFSKLAFTTRQIGSIMHLVDESSHSYAMPDHNTRFPFLTIEFKSQAKKGTHFVATNQTASPGAIALNGQLELMRRAYSVTALDTNAPRFFSLTIDQVYAQINVHWVGGGPAQGEPYSFHVKMVARHFLDSVEGVRAVAHAVGNILDHGIDTLLPSVCEALVRMGRL